MTVLDSWTHTGATSPAEHTSSAQDELSRTLVATFSPLILTGCSADSFKLHWDAVCNIFDRYPAKMAGLTVGQSLSSISIPRRYNFFLRADSSIPCILAPDANIARQDGDGITTGTTADGMYGMMFTNANVDIDH